MGYAPSLFLPDPSGLFVPAPLPGGIQWPAGSREVRLPERPRTLVEQYWAHPEELQHYYVRDEVHGHYRKGTESRLLHLQRTTPPSQQLALAWLRDHVHRGLPRAWYQLVLGHDLHLATYATLHAHHYHAHVRDPWTGAMGWWENLGRVSQGKVTIAFRDFEVDQLQSSSSLYSSFKYHETGLSATAEANTDTALITTTAIARVAGTQTEVTADVYRSVATVTADTTETWQEHGIFNAVTGPSLMDRSLLSPTAAVVNLDTVQFTYSLTKVAEA